MRTSNVIEGLQALAPFYDGKAYTLGAEHDVIYAYATVRPLPPEVVEKMNSLGWFQEHTEGIYDPDESWAAYT